MSKLSDFEVQELACYVCGLTEKQTDELLNKDDRSEEELLFDRYGIDFEQFYNIVSDLIKFTPVVQTALSGMKVQAFVRGNVTLARIFVEEQND